MFLERILYCASSALVSAVATFSLTRLLQRRRRVIIEKGPLADPWLNAKLDLDEKSAEKHLEADQNVKPVGKDCAKDHILVEKERQLQAAEARSQALEAELATIREDKEAAEDACQDLEERLAEAAKVAKDARHQLGKTKFAQKEIEDSFEALQAEKEAALNKIQLLRREKSDAQKSENECRTSFTGLQRSLSSQTSDRKSAERLAKKLDMELTEAKASKSRVEAHFRSSLQKLEEKLNQSEAEKQASQKDLAHHVSQASAARGKVQVLGGDYLKLQQSHQQAQDRLRDVVSRHVAEKAKHAETTEGLRTALERIRELEKELRITKETARNQIKRTLSSLSSTSESSSSLQINLK